MSKLAATCLLTFALPLAAQTSTPYPGLTYIDTLGQFPQTLLIDSNGAIVHVWNFADRPGVASYLDSTGNVLRPYIISPTVIGGGGGVQRLAFDGTVLWDYIPPGPGEQHHDIHELPNGNILMIMSDPLTLAQMTALGRDPANTTANWISEKIIEVQPTGPSSGTIVWQWRAIDHLVQDFNAAAPDFDVVNTRPGRIDVNYPVSPSSTLWMHMNAIDYNEQLDQVVVSCRNWSELWVIDHSTTTVEAAGSTGGNQGKGGDLLYRWGNPDAYQTVGVQRLSGQHDVNWVRPGRPGAGNLICFNNFAGALSGMPGASAVTEIVPPVSATGSYPFTVGQSYAPLAPVWEFFDVIPTDLFSDIVSSAERLPNGNTLILAGRDLRAIEVGLNDQIVWDVTVPFAFKARRYDFTHWAGGDELSATTGGLIPFDLIAGTEQAGNLYFLGGSITGTDPGFQFGTVIVPLVPDAYLLASAGSVLLPGSIGMLDANGRASAAFDLPPLVGAGFVGTTFYHSFLVLDSATLTPTMASNPRGILLTP